MINQDPKLMSDEELEQFNGEQSLVIKCLTFPNDTLTFSPADKHREMIVSCCFNGETSEIHIGNVGAAALIHHLKEQFGL